MRSLAAICFALYSAAAVLAVDERTASENVNSFDSVDRDNNGRIDVGEFERWMKERGEGDDRDIMDSFSKYDLDRSHSLDVSEFVPLAYALAHKSTDTEETIFRRMDVNNDGVVDAGEQLLLRTAGQGGVIDGILAVADSNADGKLSFEEYRAALALSKPKTQAELNREAALAIISYVDGNGDNLLQKAEIALFASKYSKVSAEEVSMVVSQVDADGDGVLSLADLERLPRRVNTLLGLAPPPTL